MVLDSKVMEWAGRQGLDTAALKKAKVPIFGKWYFPDLPANTPLVNLSTGETEQFPAGYRAGAVLYVKVEDLRTAGIGPYKGMATPALAAAPAPAPAAPVAAASVAAASVAAAPVAAVAVAPARPAPVPRPAPMPSPAAHHAPAPAAHAPAHGAGHSAPARDAGRAHPGPKQYVMIALILSAITAIEVWVYYIPALLPFIFPILIVLSLVKFVMVVGWFMHLRFDHSAFAWLFAAGLGLAIATFSGLILLNIATSGLPPGDGNAQVFPPSLAPSTAPAAKPAGH